MVKSTIEGISQAKYAIVSAITLFVIVKTVL